MVRLAYNNDLEVESILEQVKRDSYGRQACAVMILVAHEVDAMSATTMLTSILKFHSIAYTIRPVANLAQIRQSFNDIKEADSIRTVFMINCGALYNIPTMLGIEFGGRRCIIIDNHRPIHIKNIHSEHSVVVFDHEDAINTDNIQGFIPEDDSDLDEELALRELVRTNGDTTDDSSDSDSDSDSDSESSDDDSHVGDERRKKVSSSLSPTISEDEHENDILSHDGSHDSHDNDADDEIEEDGNDNDDNSIHDNSNSNSNSNNSSDDERENEGETSGEFDANDMNANGNDEDDEDDEDEDDVDHQVRRVKRRRILDPKREKKKLIRRYFKSRRCCCEDATSYVMTHVGAISRMNLNSNFYWSAILGITDQWHRGNMSSEYYNSICEKISQELYLINAKNTVATNYKVPSLLSELNNNNENNNENDDNDVTEYDSSNNLISRSSLSSASLAQGSEAGKVEESIEYRFFLYRHWSLYDSMCYSSYVASKIPIWKSHGKTRLREMLALLSIPLQDCYQNFSFMSPELKRNLHEELIGGAVPEQFHFTSPECYYRSFVRYNSFRNQIAALDVVLAASALVEICKRDDIICNSNDNNRNNNDNNNTVTNINTNPTSSSKGVFNGFALYSQLDAFNDAYDCLTTSRDDLLQKGVAAAIQIQKIIVKQAASMLDSPKAILPMIGSFNYAILELSPSHSSNRSDNHNNNDNNNDNNDFMIFSNNNSITTNNENDDDEIEEPLSRPMVLSRLGHFLQKVQCENGRWTGSKALPLILCSERAHSWVVLGIASPEEAWNPRNNTTNNINNNGEENEENSNQNNFVRNPNFQFEKYFPKAARVDDATWSNDSFDSCMIEVSKPVDIINDFVFNIHLKLNE